MNEFSESMEVKYCSVTVGYDGDKAIPCGRETYLELCNYWMPIPICKGHINKFRTRSQSRKIRYVT